MTTAPTATWHNWARTESAAPRASRRRSTPPRWCARCSPPASAAARSRWSAAATASPAIAVARRHHAAPGRAHRHRRRRPRRDDRDRARPAPRCTSSTPRLAELGLSLHNMGDIAEQTIAGAISTGTHGTGGRSRRLSAQVAGLELVTGTGEVLARQRRRAPRRLRRRPGSGSARSGS